MAIVFLVLAAGLAVAAYRADDKAGRWFMAICCVGNLAAAVHMIAKDDRYAFRFKPNDGYYEPAYRR